MAENNNIESDSLNGEIIIEPSLAEKLTSLPSRPGIYQFKNKADKIIYVGKAKILKNRVRSYFQNKRPVDAKTKAMLQHIADVEVIVVDSEAEAFLLEDTLIKKLKPKYNVLLRDDKSYPYVRVTNEPFPRIFPTRKVIKDGSKYIGPYTEVRPIKQLMRVLRSIFNIRSCDLNLTEEAIQRKKFKVCLDYHIEKCEGPCEGFILKEKYNANIKQAIQILMGKTRDLEKEFEAQMLKLSEDMRFEEAARVRNKLQLLKEYSTSQKMVSADPIDRDVFAISRLDEQACSVILKIRDGKLIGKRHFLINDALDLSDESIMHRTIETWYLESDFIPKEIFLQNEPEDFEYIMDWLNKKRGKSIEFSIPKLGDKKKLVAMAAANAEYILRDYQLALLKREQTIPRILQSLQRDLRLKKPPIRIECFDNSHIQGSELVSSLVVFEDGKPKNSDYRKFKIQTVSQIDDFAAMKEVVGRRYSRVIAEKQDLPDLIIIDGGKGQLPSAVEVLEELNIMKKVNIIGLAKRLEEVFFPGQSESLLLPKTSSSLRLLQQVRDEAHRFAITFHRQQRTKRTLQTELTKINGIGESIAKKLLIEFGSVENVKKAGEESLSEVIGRKAAISIIEYFNKIEQHDVSD